MMLKGISIFKLPIVTMGIKMKQIMDYMVNMPIGMINARGMGFLFMAKLVKFLVSLEKRWEINYDYTQ